MNILSNKEIVRPVGLKILKVYKTPDMTKKQKEEFKKKLRDSTRELVYQYNIDKNNVDLYI